jgi:hypothetical protein
MPQVSTLERTPESSLIGGARRVIACMVRRVSRRVHRGRRRVRLNTHIDLPRREKSEESVAASCSSISSTGRPPRRLARPHRSSRRSPNAGRRRTCRTLPTSVRPAWQRATPPTAGRRPLLDNLAEADRTYPWGEGSASCGNRPVRPCSLQVIERTQLALFKRNESSQVIDSMGLTELAPQAGFEPATLRLTAGCSAVELLRNRGVRRTRGTSHQL